MKDKTPVDKTPVDNKGDLHGYQEWYEDDKLYFRGTYKHGKPIGYEEWHKIYTDSTTSFYII